MAREVTRTVVVGMQGVGKSYATIDMMLNAARGSETTPPRKGLIFDVNDEFGSFVYEGPGSVNGMMSIKAIAMKDITLFTINNRYEVRRIRPYFDDTGKLMSLDDMSNALVTILERFNNGILLVEDPNKYIADNLSGDIVGKLISTRHRSTDMIMHFQNVGRAGQPKIFGNASFIRMHKTNDLVSRHKEKFQEKTELLQIAEAIVTEKYYSGDKRFYLYIDVEYSKIRGIGVKFTLQDAVNAVHEYCSQNYNEVVKPYLRKRSFETGLPLYNAQQAIEAARKDKLKLYFSPR